jgi:hypothetical protein
MKISAELQERIDKIIELLINEENEEVVLNEISKLSSEEQEKVGYVVATLFDTQ